MSAPCPVCKTHRAYTDAANYALKTADLDGIADVYRPLE
jgi:hypothetical protein